MDTQTIEITKYGEANEMVFSNKELKNELADNEVQIEVHYSGINFADIVMRLGMYKDAPPKPFVPGYEVSGVIKKVGSAVTRFTVGEKVMAGTRFGGYSSHVIVNEWQVLKTNELSLKEASAVPVNYITAFIALHEFARIREGDKILIDCATGGVGVFALQMAKEVGAQVIGLTSSPAKKEFIESFGAKAYTHDEFLESSEKNFDFILNSRGGKTIKDQYKRLARSGQLSCIGLQAAIKDGKSSWPARIKAILQTPIYPLLMLVMNSRSVGGFNALDYFDDDEWMKKNMKKMEEMNYKPHVGAVFKAQNVASAHEFLESKQAKGKVVLEWEH